MRPLTRIARLAVPALVLPLAVGSVTAAAAETGASVGALDARAAAAADAEAGDQSWRVPRRARVVIDGHGYGHGHGMSQHGAEGAARQGLDAAEILDFYYPGTQPRQDPARLQVLITDDTTDDVVVLPRHGLRVRSLSARQTWRLPVNGATRWRLRVTADGSTAVAYHDGRWRRWKRLTGDAEFRAAGRPVTLVTPSGTASYRGTLRAAAPQPGSRSRDTVNVVATEAYLRGVVPLEIPASWSPAAVQAQAVAARTYAAYERRHPRARHYDICDTTSCQVYGGADVEHPLSDAAVRATRRTVLFHDGAPAFTQFSSSSGGWTSAGSRPYLVAQPDPYDGWAGNTVHDWNVQATDRTLERAYPGIGNLRRITVLERDGNGEWGGRVEQMRLNGSRGSVTISGDDLRWALGLRSSWFTFAVASR